MREPKASLQELVEFFLKAALVTEAAPDCVRGLRRVLTLPTQHEPTADQARPFPQGVGTARSNGIPFARAWTATVRPHRREPHVARRVGAIVSRRLVASLALAVFLFGLSGPCAAQTITWTGPMSGSQNMNVDTMLPFTTPGTYSLSIDGTMTLVFKASAAGGGGGSTGGNISGAGGGGGGDRGDRAGRDPAADPARATRARGGAGP